MGPKINGVTIIQQIGNGAGSVVFKARDDKTGDLLVIKSVTPEIVYEIQKLAPSPEYADDPVRLLKVYLSQLRNEWKFGHRLTVHASAKTGIVRIHKLMVKRGLSLIPRALHLMMDFAPGQSLKKKTDYSLEQMARIYRQAAETLRFMHSHNVIHADMKPQHIMVDEDGSVRILDLGLACAWRGHTAQIAGSLDYMAPEQLACAGVDESTDVFGLGATMFRVLTGRTIRPSVAVVSVHGAVDLQARPMEQSIREYNPAVPSELEDIVLRSCEPSCKARLALTEVISRLDRLV